MSRKLHSGAVLEEGTISHGVEQAVAAVEELSNLYLKGTPVIVLALDAWHDELLHSLGSVEKVFDRLVKPQKGRAELGEIKFNRVALDFALVNMVTDLMHSVEKLEEECKRLNFVIGELCTDGK